MEKSLSCCQALPHFFDSLLIFHHNCLLLGFCRIWSHIISYGLGHLQGKSPQNPPCWFVSILWCFIANMYLRKMWFKEALSLFCHEIFPWVIGVHQFEPSTIVWITHLLADQMSKMRCYQLWNLAWLIWNQLWMSKISRWNKWCICWRLLQANSSKSWNSVTGSLL